MIKTESLPASAFSLTIALPVQVLSSLLVELGNDLGIPEDVELLKNKPKTKMLVDRKSPRDFLRGKKGSNSPLLQP